MTAATAKTATARTAVGFRNILFATDFSPAAAQAVPYVKRIAKHYDADVVALYVRPPVVNPMMEPATWPIDIEAAKAQDALCRQQLLDTLSGIRAKVLIEEGSIDLCLKSAMEANHTDLVVIGTRGRTGAAKLLLGSVAEEIFRTVTCPVLTVGPHATMAGGMTRPIREILYATDFSPESTHACGLCRFLGRGVSVTANTFACNPKPKTGRSRFCYGCDHVFRTTIAQARFPGSSILVQTGIFRA